MRSFQFSMQTLLDSREAFEKAAQVKLAAAQRDLEAARHKLSQLMARMSEQIREMESFDGTRLDRSSFGSHIKFLERVQHQVSTQTQRVALVEASVEEHRNRLHGIMRERKTIEKLKEKEKHQWIEEARRSDQKEMDEFAVTGFQHRRSTRELERVAGNES